MDPYFWPRGLVAEFTPTAKCRHCRADIEQLPNKLWADAKGLMVCVKAPTPIQPGYQGVVHQPMPDGLEGAPQDQQATA